MSAVVKAEFYAVYEFKKMIEECARTASGIEGYAADLHLPKTAFSQVESASKVQAAWKTVCDDRTKEAAALSKEFSAVATMLGNVLTAYGVTDEEMAKAISHAGRLEAPTERETPPDGK